ncbi:STAS domain-containing protein [Fodinisporobacter ferrooxydans]|uniref:STAS domain-containing protein n=1 Tax=Fodinisporobacter ferrooxydans TaxID=2901836 RepID=A0ABY4CT19_9BACL|nr:STAS domain-containing protein [Alicyclobacillaceae bacterium MYW30-H2]
MFFQTYPWLASFHESKDILFDFTNTRYINSAGIALLIRYVREARQKEYFCYAVGVSSHYQKIFRIVGLSSYIENFPDAFSFFERMRLRRSYSNER